MFGNSLFRTSNNNQSTSLFGQSPPLGNQMQNNANISPFNSNITG